MEGMEEGQWVLMDYNDVVIHIFSQPLREFYNLEGLWAEAPQRSVRPRRLCLISIPFTPGNTPRSGLRPRAIRHE